MGGDAESTRTDDYVGIRELAPSRNGQRRVRETDGTRLHNVVLSDVHSPAARANYRAFAPRPNEEGAGLDRFFVPLLPTTQLRLLDSVPQRRPNVRAQLVG